MRRVTLLIALSLTLAAVPAAAQEEMSVDEIIDIAASGVGSPYVWGGGCWDINDRTRLGADCSGYVAKAWQVPEPSAVTTCSHPYTTENFYSDRSLWSSVDRDDIERGDALVRRDGDSGHIVIFNSGDPWGNMDIYEARGTAYGIVHRTTTRDSSYTVIRRNALEEDEPELDCEWDYWCNTACPAGTDRDCEEENCEWDGHCNPDCSAGDDPDCTTAPDCDADGRCNSDCSSDPDCSSTPDCDSDSWCNSACSYDPDCSTQDCDADGRCNSSCSYDPDCSTQDCDSDGRCNSACSYDPDCTSNVNCDWDSHCEVSCPTGADPDCEQEVCVSDNWCNVDCPSGLDPDCACPNDDVCDPRCGASDPDCRDDCGSDGICPTTCPAGLDPDCAGEACGVDQWCNPDCVTGADPDCCLSDTYCNRNCTTTIDPDCCAQDSWCNVACAGGADLDCSVLDGTNPSTDPTNPCPPGADCTAEGTEGGSFDYEQSSGALSGGCSAAPASTFIRLLSLLRI